MQQMEVKLEVMVNIKVLIAGEEVNLKQMEKMEHIQI